MDLVTFGVQLLNAVQYGMVLFLVASGLTLVFGILGVINLAHGAFYMLGAYLAYWIAAMTGSFWLALVGGVAIAFVVGWLLEIVFVRRLYGRDHLAQVLLCFGLILVIDEIRQIAVRQGCAFGRAAGRVCRGSIQLTDNLSYPVYRLAICVFCLLVAAVIFLVIRRTKIGMIVRAGAENREMTRVLGIPFDKVNRYVFAVGIALAALGGIVVVADLDRVSRHGRQHADPVLRGRCARRHRLGRGRGDRRAADRSHRYVRQGVLPERLEHPDLCADGGGAAVAPQRHSRPP